jgi:hypothetical protein
MERLPVRKAAGRDPMSNGARRRQGSCPAREKRMTVMEATARFRTSAVGRITSGATPARAIRAK